MKSDGGEKEKDKKQKFYSDDLENVAEENGGLPNCNLPGELLAKIIAMVPISQWASLELVNHQFQDVVHELWLKLTEIRLDELACNKEKKAYEIVEAILKKFLIRAPDVTSISGFAQFCHRRSSIRLSTIHLLSKFQHLETIDFSGERVISARTFAAFLKLSASRESWKRLDIVDGIYGHLKCHNAVDSKNQSALNLEYFKFNTNNLGMFDRFLPIEWSGLKELVIVDSSESANELLSIIRQCHQVARLETMVPDCWNGNRLTSYADFMQGVADLENLSVLKIVGSWSLDKDFNDAILALIEDLGRRHIIDLSLVACYCNNQILGAIIDHLPRLKSLELDVSKCTTESLIFLVNRMGQLESLKFRSRNSKIDGTIIRAICGNMSGLRCLHLDFLECNSEDFNRLGDLRLLKELGIGLRNIESGIFESWTCLGFGSRLESLELSVQNGISAGTMGDFLKNAPRLRKIRLEGATDDILKAIGESCPNLVELCIDSSSKITSIGIQSVIDHCSQLKILNVAGCNHSGWFPSALNVGKYRKINFK